MIKKILLNFLSLINIFYLNFYFIILRLLGKKIIVFYFGNIGSFENHNILVSEIIKKNINNKIIIFKISEIFKKRFFFNFINLRFIKYLNFANFISTNTDDRNLPKNTINILIPHDFYDTFSNFKNYKKIGKIKDVKLINYNYIFCPNIVVKKFYENKILAIKKKLGISKYIKSTKVIIIGYFKYDYIQKFIKLKKSKKNILILGTSLGVFSNIKIISKLLNKLLIDFYNYNLIFRPHPKENKYLIKSIKKKFIKNKKIIIDLNPKYIDSFNKSEFAIADYTGSAYSYSLLTLKPVIFYFNKKLDKSQKKTNFYKDIKNIGVLAKSISDIKKKHNFINKKKIIYQRKIKNFKKLIFPESDNFIKNFNTFFNKNNF